VWSFQSSGLRVPDGRGQSTSLAAAADAAPVANRSPADLLQAEDPDNQPAEQGDSATSHMPRPVPLQHWARQRGCRGLCKGLWMTGGTAGRWMTWRAATRRALYDDGGFYRRTDGPAGHFRTSVHASRGFAEALLTLARSAGLNTIADIGSGRGELLRTLHDLDPSVHLIGVEIASRPADLPAPFEWLDQLPAALDALLVGNEWLDNVPVDLARRAGDDVRLVVVDPSSGVERVGPCVSGRDAEWLDMWWPLPDGGCAEIGHPRDDAWSAAIRSLGRGIAVAADYEHRRDSRPVEGSLTGYAAGRQVPPVPDGSCDITSHVALDACAAAGLTAGAGWSVHTTQRQALRALGGPRPLPAYDLAARDPADYLAWLSRASHDAELTRRGGLGDFGWLVQGRGVPCPEQLVQLSPALSGG
jgi:SAM-dependent MidA family methyltransferase